MAIPSVIFARILQETDEETIMSLCKQPRMFEYCKTHRQQLAKKLVSLYIPELKLEYTNKWTTVWKSVYKSKKNIKNRKWFEVAKQAAEDGILDVVKYAETQRKFNWNKILEKAALGGDINIVRYTLDKGARRLAKAFYNAAKVGNLHIIRLFESLTSNVPYSAGLQGAAERGDIDLINYFVEKGASAWEDAAERAAYGGHLDIVQYCEERSNNIDWNQVAISAALQGHLNIVIYADSKIDSNYIRWETVLENAAVIGSIDTVNYALTYDVRNIENAIKIASENGHLELIKYLCGVSMERINIDAAAIAAAKGGHLNIIRYYKTKGANIMKTLEPAFRNDHLHIIKYIMDNLVESLSYSSAESGSIELIQYLEKIGNIDWREVIHAAISEGDVEIIDYIATRVKNNDLIDILNYGMEFVPDIKTGKHLISKGATDMDSLLQAAAHHNSIDLARLALEQGATDTETAINVALENDNDEIFEFLQSQN